MRQINHIVLHCTATPQNTSVASILDYWRETLKWKNPGYHWLILPSGQAVQLLSIDRVANGVAGHNHDSVHISYIGGIDKNKKAVDNRTVAQKWTQIRLIRDLKGKFPNADILGHRDFPGVTKECPSFDVREWVKNSLITRTNQ